MRRLLLALAWMSLVSPACGDTDRDLPREYRAIEIPAARLASTEAVSRGGDLFQKYCTLCHGVRGDGKGLQHEGLNPAPRDFTDPGWRQRTTPRHVYFAIREGVATTAMPSWKSLTEQDGWDLTAYVLSLARN
ncbi:MAG: cytochrome c [Vicinamibacterales bacterium]